MYIVSERQNSYNMHSKRWKGWEWQLREGIPFRTSLLHWMQSYQVHERPQKMRSHLFPAKCSWKKKKLNQGPRQLLEQKKENTKVINVPIHPLLPISGHHDGTNSAVWHPWTIDIFVLFCFLSKHQCTQKQVGGNSFHNNMH